MTPTELMQRAERVKVIYNGPYAADYAPVVEVLRTKNLGWQGIQQFFYDNGLSFSLLSLQASWRRWKRRQDELLIQAAAHAQLAEELTEQAIGAEL
jgi:hypothetical protein